MPADGAVTPLAHRAGYTHVRTSDGTLGWLYSRYLTAAVQPGPGLAPADSSGGLPLGSIAALPKQAPEEAHLAACPDVGRAAQRVDSETNLLKNRVDEGTYQMVPIAAVLALPWQGMPTRRYNWDQDARSRTAEYESAAVSVTGYIVGVNPEGAEATNCGKDSADWIDWHMWLVGTKAEADAGDKRQAVVVESTPRIRKAFPGRLTLEQVRAWRTERRQVVVSGWLMLDPDHPTDATGTANKKPSRGTIWEVHPVMKIEPAAP